MIFKLRKNSQQRPTHTLKFRCRKQMCPPSLLTFLKLLLPRRDFFLKKAVTPTLCDIKKTRLRILWPFIAHSGDFENTEHRNECFFGLPVGCWFIWCHYFWAEKAQADLRSWSINAAAHSKTATRSLEQFQKWRRKSQKCTPSNEPSGKGHKILKHTNPEKYRF